MVPRESRTPDIACSVGTGEVLRECVDVHKVKKVMVGSGGSAFVDGGFWCLTSGMQMFKAYDKNGNVIDTDRLKPNQIREVARLEISNEDNRKLLDELEIVMPCDV